MRSYRYVVVDVFTDRALAGNALAVFTDARGLDAGELQALARELNLSESVFVLPREADGQARLRIFTPSREVPFAGHPVLGAAFVIGAAVQLDVIALETGQGLVPVRLTREGARVTFGWMTQPRPTEVPFDQTPSLLGALGVDRVELPVRVYDNGLRHALVAVADRATVAGLAPDLAALARLPVTCVSVFAGGGAAYKSRTFAPAGGVAEDPATGSAAGPIAAHLLRHGRLAPGATIEIEQGAEVGRPSRLHARAEGAIGNGAAEDVTRVEVGGAAVVVARGEFRL